MRKFEDEPPRRRAGINRHQAAGNPTPRAIRVAIKGIDAKPTNSTLMIQPGGLPELH